MNTEPIEFSLSEEERRAFLSAVAAPEVQELAARVREAYIALSDSLTSDARILQMAISEFDVTGALRELLGELEAAHQASAVMDAAARQILNTHH